MKLKIWYHNRNFKNTNVYILLKIGYSGKVYHDNWLNKIIIFTR